MDKLVYVDPKKKCIACMYTKHNHSTTILTYQAMFHIHDMKNVERSGHKINCQGLKITLCLCTMLC